MIGSRNEGEAATLAKIIDCIDISKGVMRAKDEPVMELAIRHLAAVMTDRTGTWSVAHVLEEEQDDLVSKTDRRR